MSEMPFFTVSGVIPCSSLYATWIARRRSVSSIAVRIAAVSLSAYMITLPRMLRAARNVEGKVLMYADKQTEAMRKAIDETDRRRAIQVQYNIDNGITAETIVKGISDITEFLMGDSKVPKSSRRRREKRIDMEPAEIEQTIVELEEEMLAAAEELRFEYAAKLRDEIRDLRRELDEAATAR